MANVSGHPAKRWFAFGVGVIAAAYGGYVAATWRRYGSPAPPRDEERDALLDRFMPIYDIAERHHVRVNAPAAVTLAAAREADMQANGLVRAIFRMREVILGATAHARRQPRGLLEEVLSLGWGVLTEVPDREVVIGAVTRPWEADVVFRALPPDRFAAFDEPGYVKIAWTLRADVLTGVDSIFRTETRAVATDDIARARFRRYWSLLSPGIVMIRWGMLGSVRKDAERRAGRLS
jgi:hypothetical protein